MVGNGKNTLSCQKPTPIESNATGWQQQLERDVPFQWLNQDIHYKCTLTELKELLVKGELIGVADGLYLHPTGAAAFCLANKKGCIKIFG